MIDFLIKDASVVDGSGGALYAADVAVSNGKITQIGRITDAARETINAQGAWLTPGFVDIHSHYDGQASWDETFSPSIHHGTTTVVLGNCGVGFAPLARNTQDEQQRLIRLMEGVEDIPGVALAEGVKFNWTDFPSYMNALDAMPHSLDYACLVPHDPLRMAVMGERALAQEVATVEDCAQMQTLLKQALKAGAAGFSTGRSDNHRTSRGEWTPASEAGDAELNALAAAFKDVQHGVIQLVNDFDVLRGTTHEDDAAKARFDAEFSRIKQMAQISAKPLSMTWLQRDPGGVQWQWLAQAVERCAAEGLPMYMQTAARGIGVITGLDTAFHALMGFPLYKEVAHLPLPERAAALRDPLRRARLLSEKSERLAGDGYHRKAQGPSLSRAARILASADVYQAMLERRPHRPALDAEAAQEQLLAEAAAGRLCPEAVDAVLAAAGHRVAKRPRELPGGLTEREYEVLLALASGKTNKEIADDLGISAKTAGNHVQRIFDKTGVRTRSAATVWAFERHLVRSA